MQRNHIVPLMAVGLATSYFAWASPSESVEASSSGNCCSATLDSDNDFLPDAVEWVLLSNSHKVDTDADGISDFIEVVEGGQPRHQSPVLPADQQMRLVVTGPLPESSDPRTWIHVFHRVMTAEATPGSGPAAIQSFATWYESPSYPGIQLPLNSFATSETIYRERITPTDGIWVQVSIPLVPEATLSSVLPCTIWAESVIAGETVTSGTNLVNTSSGVASLVPFDEWRYVFQILTPQPANMMVTESNQVCVIELKEQTSGAAGTTYQVTDADCEDANELECSTACQQSIGWTVTIPGGTALVGGN
jgi:hypothetical protein